MSGEQNELIEGGSYNNRMNWFSNGNRKSRRTKNNYRIRIPGFSNERVLDSSAAVPGFSQKELNAVF